MNLDAAVLAMMIRLQPRVNHDKLARVTAAALIAEPPIFADGDVMRAALNAIALLIESRVHLEKL